MSERKPLKTRLTVGFFKRVLYDLNEVEALRILEEYQNKEFEIVKEN